MTTLKDKKVLKSLSDTRWSAVRIDAVSAVHDGHSEISDALDGIATDQTQTSDTGLEALSFQEKLVNLKMYF